MLVQDKKDITEGNSKSGTFFFSKGFNCHNWQNINNICHASTLIF